MSSISGRDYARPPITEATIEFRLRDRIDRDVTARVSRGLVDRYPHEQLFQAVNVTVGIGQDATATTALSGFRRINDDNTHICQITETFISSSVLAPYPGWSTFVELAKQNYILFRQEAGIIPLSRIGVRYINRIDVPLSRLTAPVPLSGYLKCYPEFPDEFPPVKAFGLQGVGQIVEDKLEVIINETTVESLLVDHASILLDIDVGRVSDIPLRPEDIWLILAMMRDRKNMLFEACLTDRARELFS